jgi:hypothetical protein
MGGYGMSMMGMMNPMVNPMMSMPGCEHRIRHSLFDARAMMPDKLMRQQRFRGIGLTAKFGADTACRWAMVCRWAIHRLAMA